MRSEWSLQVIIASHIGFPSGSAPAKSRTREENDLEENLKSLRERDEGLKKHYSCTCNLSHTPLQEKRKRLHELLLGM
jgi:hypothetical protein